MNGKPNTLTPQMRFPEFKDGPAWDAVNGNELFDLVDRRPAPLGLPILAITQEHGAVPRDHIDYHVSVTEASIASYKEVQPTDFIISLRSFQGGIEYSHYHGICSPAYLILKRTQVGSDDYFRHLFKSDRFIQQLTRNIEGLRDGKMISYKQFSEQLLPTPAPPEQRKIAACLTSLDEWIGAERRKLEALHNQKKALMQQLFPREGETRPRLRFPEFHDAPEWRDRKLDDLTTRGSGHTPSKGTPEYYNGGIKWVSLADSKRLDCGLIFETEVEISEQGIRNSSAVLHAEGSVILSRDAGVGKSAVLACPMAVSQHFIVWTCDSEQLSNWFLYYELQKMKPLFERIATGSTIKTIGLPFFIQMRLRAPAVHEQERVASCLRSLDVLIAAQSRKLGGLRAHKTGLLQQLFPSPEGV
jgi:type I restriction enzyme S subunit